MSRKLSRFIALVIAVLIVLGSVPFVSAESLPEQAAGYNRYYFYMPKDWYNEYTTTASVYWWEGTDAGIWPGYAANSTDVDGVFYYDVPQDVTTIVWANGIDGGTDDTLDIYNASKSTVNIGSEYYDMDESVNYPDGTENFDGMIYVIDPNKTIVNEFSNKETFAGEWYYYYGNGEYGFQPDKEDCEEVFTGRTRSLSGEVITPDSDETYTYYFYMPEDWYNEFSDSASIYWWEGSGACEEWPGNKANATDVKGVYSYEVPSDVTTIIWSNGVVGGDDKTLPVYKAAKQTAVIGSEYYTYYESEFYPGGTDNFDEMIYVINPDKTNKNEYSGKETFEGEWFYYYGNGEYGITRDKEDCLVVLSDRTFTGTYKDVNGIESIEVISDTIELIKGGNGYLTTRFNEETEEYEEYFRYVYDEEDIKIKINLVTGESVELGYEEVYQDETFDVIDNQSDVPWKLGTENELKVTYKGMEALVPVVVKESSVKSIELVNSTVECIENYDGYISDKYNYDTGENEEYFDYSYDFDVKVTYQDGSTEIVDTYDYVEGFYVGTEDDQYENHWTVGNEYTVKISYLDLVVEGKVKIVENPVESIEVIGGPVTCIENYDGYFSEYYNYDTEQWEKFFEYKINYNNLQFVINYTDGTQIIVDGADRYDYDIDVDSGQDDTPWVGTGKHTVVVEYFNRKADFTVEVVEPPIKSIKVISAPELMEEYNGFWTESYNETTKKLEHVFYYAYSRSGFEIEISYKDGTKETVNLDDYNKYDIDIEDTQDETPWKLNGKHTVTLSCMDVETETEVTILPSPVKSIKVLSGEAECVKNVYGYWEEAYNEQTDSVEEYFHYYYDFDNLEVEITYTDGSKEISNSDNDYSPYFDSYDDQSINHWSELGKYTATLCFYNAKTDFTVNVVEDNVESIKVLSGKIECVENIDGYWDDRYNEETDTYEDYFRYEYDYDDLEIEVTYKDGTKEVMEGYWGDFHFEDNQDTSPWTKPGKYTAVLTYRGAETEVEVEVVENKVASIKVVSDAIELTENIDGYWDVSYNEETQKHEEVFVYDYDEEDIELEVTYKDGTKETVEFNYFSHDFSVTDDQYDHPWTKLGEYKIAVEYMECKAEHIVKIVENNVESIKVINGKLECVFECDGYWEETDNPETNATEEIFWYTYPLSSLEYEITYKNGEKEIVNSDNFYDFDIDSYSNQYDSPWLTTGKYEVTVEYRGAEVVVPVEVIENPVKSIKVIPDVVEVVEGVYCDFGKSFNKLTGKLENYFNYFGLSRYIDIEVTYNDGTTEILEKDDDYYYDQFDIVPEVEARYWKLGDEINAEVNYMNHTDTVTFKVVESPVEKIEVISGGDYVYVEGHNGYWYTDVDENGEDISRFYYYTDNTENILVRIYYKDGSTVDAYVYDEVDKGYIVSSYHSQYDDPWTIGGDNYITISYMDISVDVPVTVEKSKVKSIEYIGNPLQLVKETNGAWYNCDLCEEEHKYYRYDDFKLSAFAKVKITYLDGTERTVGVYDDIDGYFIGIEQDQYENHWVQGGENFVTLNFMGQSTKVPVEIVNSEEELLPEFELGDVTCDGKVNIKDATYIQKYVAKLAEMDDAQMSIADYNGDGVVNVKDATTIQKKLAGLI